MEHLITPKEVIESGRPINPTIKETKLLAYICEAEQLNIKPVFGDSIFLDLLNKGEDDERYQRLLSGGTYSTPDGNIYSFVGLKTCISYFVFAKVVMVGDFQVTRFGTVLKDSEHSTHISSKERSDCYNDSLEVANGYLSDCIRYCRHVGILSAISGPQRASGGIRIRKLG